MAEASRGRAAQHDGPGQEQVEAEVLSRRVGAAVMLAGGAVLVYFGFLRDWHLQWGATAQEAGGEVAGDELMPDPDIVATRAVEIDAPPSAVWPWLVQFGPGRGGAYTYDWIENLMGLDIHSTDQILPEFQRLEVGDAFPLGKGPVIRVASIEPQRSVVFRSDDGHWVWSFTLVQQADGRTRLLSRNRISSPEAGPIGRAFNTAVMEPGSLVMERKMLLGFKERA